jgi:hypothetical protein
LRPDDWLALARFEDSDVRAELEEDRSLEGLAERAREFCCERELSDALERDFSAVPDRELSDALEREVSVALSPARLPRGSFD